jgi:hypothetical protein
MALRRFLAEIPVLALSAISSRADLRSRDVLLSPWLSWQHDLLGLRQDRSDLVPLVEKGSKVTAAALVDRTGPRVKALSRSAP